METGVYTGEVGSTKILIFNVKQIIFYVFVVRSLNMRSTFECILLGIENSY